MSLYKDEAVVLRGLRLGEADRIVVFLGRASGKIRAVAKGVRKTKSRFGGRLEPFSHVSLVMWKGRGDLDTVTQADVVEPFRVVREDLDKLRVGIVMLEATDRVAQERQQSTRLFRLLVDSLHGLSAAGSPRLHLAAFLLRLSAVEGFGATLARCAECGGEPSWFSAEAGGAVCPRCCPEDAVEASGSTLGLMAELAAGGAWMDVSSELAARAVRLSRSYAEYHLDRRLRSAAALD